MKNDYSVVNFKIPNRTKDRFDEMCRLSARTRTSVLVEMIDSFILVKGIQIEEENKKLRSAYDALNERRKILSFKEYINEQSKKENDLSEPLSIFHSDDDQYF